MLLYVADSVPGLRPQVNQYTDERVPVSHPALEGLKTVTPQALDYVTNIRRMAMFGKQLGMAKIVRWKPKAVC